MATIKHEKRPACNETYMEKWLRELDEDITAAEKQAGYPVDGDISDYNVDDEDLSDARFSP